MRRILIYGDSNSFGTAPLTTIWEVPMYPRGVRWGDRMAEALGPDWEVIVQGLPGRTTVFDDPVEGEYRNGRRALAAVLLSHMPVDLFIILLGTNDQKARFALPAQDVALGVRRLVREARAVAELPEVLVICPPAIEERGVLAEVFGGAAARSAALPGHMAAVAEAEGTWFLDAGEVIAVDPVDGVHWSAEAHGVLGLTVADKVREIFA